MGLAISLSSDFEISHKSTNSVWTSSNDHMITKSLQPNMVRLGPAGYSWDEDIGACVREWDLNDSQKQAAKTAVDYVGQEYATTITDVTAGECEDCFTVKIEQGTERDVVEVEIVDGVAESKTLTRHECTEEEKQAEVCYMLYLPVCGYKADGSSMTYGNDCQACSDKVVYWEMGECTV